MSRKLKAATIVAALGAMLSIGSRLAAEPSADELRVARLVRELGADSFAVRKQASEELAKLGATARRDVEQAAHSDDPEVRLRAKDLLRAIKEYELWAAGRCKVPVAPATAAQLLLSISEQTGNHVTLSPTDRAAGEQLVELDAGESDYWPLVDQLCARIGHHCRPHFDARSPGMLIAAGRPGREPVAYAGPVRAKITSARRTFNEEMNYEETRSEKTHTFQLSLELAWEDRFRLAAYRSEAELVEAVTDAGAPVVPLRPAGGGWNVVSPGAREVTMSLRCSPPKASAQELDVLRLRWGLIAVGDMTALDVTDLDSREPHFKDDVELMIDSFQPAKGDRYELSVVVRRHRNLPEPPEMLFAEHELELLDARGEPLRRLMTGNVLSEHGAAIKATFAAGEGGEPKTLRFTYPRLRSARNLEIVFRHVPLPTARPE